MKKKSESTQQQTGTQKLSFGERLLRIKSILGTSRMACMQLADQGEPESFDIGETIQTAEDMIGDMADEIENQQS